MTTATLQRRADLQQARRSVAPSTTPAVPGHPVPATAPDHVPAHIAAEHPDASALVAGRRPAPPRSRVSVVSRPPARPGWLPALLGVGLCAGLAAAAAGIDDAPRPVRPAATAVSATTSLPAGHPATSCTHAVAELRQNPFTQLPAGAPCPSDASTARSEPMLWKLADIARDRAQSR